ncbi:MAG: nucleotidyltransferase [Bacteroidales bacterium]|nr:nucleotidyltransferase [Bacteroidales bacterium]MBQ1709241.1 nucleotidyltransferase [Bacteroidales bacterium]MBQ2598346.1 nucleotidyltransferase [Bacteroidales bacterium]MBQ4013085.1 nucleotidyltransferase [Bacteroidales bacterium]
MKPTLLVLAAGMGSRYGSLKQMDGLGPSGEAIIDYSIYDAIQAGFGKVVFVIRHSFADAFRKIYSAERFGGQIDVEFVYQELDCLPEGYRVPEGREKPWGTNHAVMMARDVIHEPFAVINSDDFYGRSGFQAVADFLRGVEGKKGQYALVGYYLKNTLSDFGSVSRGICRADANACLTEVTERTAIQRKADGKVYYAENGTDYEVSEDSVVSMNFWGFTPDYFAYSDELFKVFLDSEAVRTNPKAEFFIPYVADILIKRGDASFKVLECDAKWFGVTYKEDRPFVVSKIGELIDKGLYPRNLWAR